MKTKISAAVIGLLFLMSCGSSETPKQNDEKAVTETPKITKFILKASNMLYVTTDKDSNLVATEPVPEKAEVFEKVDLGSGKYGLRTSKGKFVSDNRNGSDNLAAILSWAAEWEVFDVIALDETRANIKSSRGKFVNIQGPQNMLFANSDDAGATGTFTLEAK